VRMLALIGSVFLFAACVSVPAYQSGTPALLDPMAISSLKIGETTKSQILERFGHPAMKVTDKSEAGEFEVWSYSFMRSAEMSVTPFGTSAGEPAKIKTLGVRFSPDGILRGITEAENPIPLVVPITQP